VKPDHIKAHIARAAKSFDLELHTESYAETHSDAAQLRRLLSFLSPRGKQTFLDLGTGNGYVGMALAQAYPTCHVIGLDIAAGAIKQDVENAKQQGLSNIHFRVFDGITLPFRDSYFDGVVCRYAFHHIPRPETILAEIARTVRHEGKFVLADPIKSEGDETDFINRFQDLKQDGHAKIYRLRELVDLVCRHGFELIGSFQSSLSFSRGRNEAHDDLLATTPAQIQEAYDVNVDAKEIHLSFKILNAVFLNLKKGVTLD
jgi:ubiquinone/menaquinone biosynthesis C-methylase UbiE